MSIFDRLFEKRNMPGWLNGTDIPSSRTAGVSITQENSTQIAAVYAAVKLYADTIASLPWGAYIKDKGVRRPVNRPRWMDTPQPLNPNITGFELRHRMVSSLLIDGNCFLLVIKADDGTPVECRVLDPQKVHIERAEDGSPIYKIETGQGTMYLTAENIVHIPLFAYGENDRGLSPVENHRVSLGIAKATSNFAARFYEQGTTLGGVIKVPGDLGQEQLDNLKASFNRRNAGLDNMHRVAVLSGGADFQQMSLKISDMDMISTMAWSTETICRIYGVPLHMLQYPGGNTSYASVELIGLEWLRLGLGPLIARIEMALQRLIPGNTTYIKFSLDGLLRASTSERYASYAVALNNGFLSVNEIRQLEDRSPIDGGDEYWKPLNIGTIGVDTTEQGA